MALLTEQRRQFHAEVLQTVLRIDDKGVPSNADGNNVASVAIAKDLCVAIGQAVAGVRPPGQTSGQKFEDAVAKFLEQAFLKFKHLRPGQWTISRINARNRLAVAGYVQFGHLRTLAELVASNASLAASLGNDYAITPDIIVARAPEPDATINISESLVDASSATNADLRSACNSLPILHASVSCKWSLRSDRAQNAKSEALNMIRNRKGRLPHLVAVTAEPLPSRLASLALGTGDIDCVYHLALPELVQAVSAEVFPDAQEMLNILISGRRLKDISDLPLDLAV